MMGQGVATLIRFLVGIFLLQGVTAVLVFTALGTDWQTTWPLFVLLGGSVGALVALWFSALVGADRRHAVARITERLSKEREDLRVKAEQQRVKAEQQRVKEARDVERQMAKVTAAAAAKGGGLGRGLSLKSGAMVGGAVGVGVALLLTQFVTIGLLTLTTAGGAALGYGVRARQEKLIAGRRADADQPQLRVISGGDPPLALEGRKRWGRFGK
jgi:hypothetical protein